MGFNLLPVFWIGENGVNRAVRKDVESIRKANLSCSAIDHLQRLANSVFNSDNTVSCVIARQLPDLGERQFADGPAVSAQLNETDILGCTITNFDGIQQIDVAVVIERRHGEPDAAIRRNRVIRQRIERDS